MHGKQASAEAVADGIDLLFDGSADADIDEPVCTGSAYANVKVHFNQVMEAETVNVYASDNTFAAIAGFDVYASMDGVNYDHVASLECGDISDEYIKMHTLTLPGTVYARDMKVVVKPDPEAGEAELYEIEILGKPAQGDRVRATSYSYDDEVPFVTQSDILAADSDLTALSDGLSAQVTTSGEHLSVIYDLGSFYQVEDITIKGNHGGFELLTSPDGYNYFSSAYYPASTTTSVAWGRAENNAKFVKLVFHKPDGAKIILSEIELYTRKLKNTKKTDTSVPVHAALKPNNIVYLDWSDYGANDEQKTYNVYIEDSYFTDVSGLTPVSVYLNNNSTKVTDIEANFATYAGFAPEATYYVAVAEKGGATAVTPIRIDTYSVTGSEELSSIFCVNEFNGSAFVESKSAILAYKNKGYTWIDEWILQTGGKVPLWSGEYVERAIAALDSTASDYETKKAAILADVVTEEELEALPEASDGAKVSKLLSDLEVVSKNRYWSPLSTNSSGKIVDDWVRSYASRGMSTRVQGAQSNDAWDVLMANGVYDSEYGNEPDGKWNNLRNDKTVTEEQRAANAAEYLTDYYEGYKTYFERIKALNPAIEVSGPTLMGIDNNIGDPYLQALFEEDADYGDYVDNWDFHMYCKPGDYSDEELDGKTNIPEYIIYKMDGLYGDGGLIPEKYQDKPMVSSETGWTSAEYDYSLLSRPCAAYGGQSPISEEEKAEYVARMYLSGAIAGVDNIYLYAFQDEGYMTSAEQQAGNRYIEVTKKTVQETDINGDLVYDENGDPVMKSKRFIAKTNPCHEHLFGIVDWYGNPKEGYYSYYTLGKMLKNAYFVERIDLPKNSFGAVFYDKVKDKYITALWEVSGNGAMVHVTSSQDSLTRVDMYGGVTTVTPGTMALTTAPFYLYSDEPLEVAVIGK